MKHYIVYQIINLLNNKIYIGVHVTHNINDKYMGSSKHLKKDIKKLGIQNFKKEILFEYNNNQEMMAKEAELVNKEFCLREDTYNLMLGGIHDFTWFDTVVVKDKDGNKTRVYKEDPRYVRGELIGVAAGTVPVIDKDGNMSRVPKDDPRYLSGELLHTSTGKPQHPNQVQTGKKRTQQSKDKMSASHANVSGSNNPMAGTMWINNGIENKVMKSNLAQELLAQGWIKGKRKINALVP